MDDYATSLTIAPGGCSWRVLDSYDAIRLEISSTLQSLTNNGANHWVIPQHLYSLAMKPQTVVIVLHWSSDTVKKGVNLQLTTGPAKPFPYEVEYEAYKLLVAKAEKTNIDACITQLGHRFVESYTEKSSMTAVWTLKLNNSCDTEVNFYKLRMAMQKYFFHARSVPEVCGFLDSKHFGHNLALEADAQVSIYGFRDPFTNELVSINNQPASVASHYLNADALSRNFSRTTVNLRTWENLWMPPPANPPPPENPVAQNFTLRSPEERYILTTEKAIRMLLLIKYGGDVPSNIFKGFAETLDTIMEPQSLKDNGTMVEDRWIQLVELGRKMEKYLPEHDPEKPPSSPPTTTNGAL